MLEMFAWSSEFQHSCFVNSKMNFTCPVLFSKLRFVELLNSTQGMKKQYMPLHSDCFAMVLTAGFYSDSGAHNVRKVRVVKVG